MLGAIGLATILSAVAAGVAQGKIIAVPTLAELNTAMKDARLGDNIVGVS